MKKLLSLILCLCMVFGLCAAHAELELPVPDPTQEALQMGFLGNVFSLLPGFDLDKNALRLEVSQADQPLFDALFQRTDALYDLSATIADTPVRVQFTEDALLAAFADQVYRLPYQSIAGLVSGLSSDAGVNTVDFTRLRSLFTTFFESAIVPSITVESIDGGTHIVFDLTQERLAESLVALGDSVAEDEQLSGLFSALGIGDFSEIWPGLRDMLGSGQLPASLHAVIVIGESDAKIEADGLLLGLPIHLDGAMKDGAVDFLFTAGELLTLSGRKSLADCGYECHVAAGDFTFDVVLTPTPDGWLYTETMTQGGATVFDCEGVLTESAFDARLTVSAAEGGAPIAGEAHFDRAACVLTGSVTLPEELGGMVIELSGEPIDTGYHIAVNVKQADALLATLDARLIDTEALCGMELTLTSPDQTDPLAKASFAYAKGTGAFSLHYDDVNEDVIDGKGLLTDKRQSFTLEMGSRGRISQRIAFDRTNDSDTYSCRWTQSEDILYDGSLKPVVDMSFNLDKRTGAFRGFCNQSREFQNVNFQGVCADGLLQFHLDSTQYGRIESVLEFNAHWNDDLLTAECLYTEGYEVWNGSLLWSPALKTLSVYGNRTQFYAALEQNESGIPQSLRILASNGRLSTAEISIDSEAFVLNNDENSMRITGGFIDASTYRIDIATSEGFWSPVNHVFVDFTVKGDGIAVTVTGGAGEKRFEATLTPVEKGEIERLDSQGEAIELTPEFITGILNSLTSVGEAEAEETPVPQD